MPALFIGHGSPMNTLEHNRYTNRWRELGAELPRPRAILAVSAHWFVNITAVTAMPTPQTIHDFYGFPEELFAFQYPAAGSPELAAEVAELVAPDYVGLDRDSWGLDHGTWSVLTHLFPEADVPVVQLSVHAGKPAEDHLALGAAIEPLRRRGVLVVASGNVVHNLRLLDPRQADEGYAWAHDFDDAARALVTERPGDLVELGGRNSYRMAAPTPDHLLPLYYLAGMADAAGSTVETITEGYQMGSLSMTSYLLPAA
ncbi:MAG: 4,5-DOPA dioxygenase extradiol [Acidimicrobiales bacterium]